MTVSMFEPKPEVQFVTDEELFDRMADFITDLDPDTLTDEQLDNAIKIMDDLEILMDDPEDELTEVRAKRAKRDLPSKKTYGRQWYRKNKQKVKIRKRKMMKSAEGRKRERAEPRLKKSGKTPTGRPIRKYNTKGHTNEGLDRFISEIEYVGSYEDHEYGAEDLLDSMVDFFITLDPDDLYDEQEEMYMDIMGRFDSYADDEDIEEASPILRKKRDRKARRKRKIEYMKKKSQLKTKAKSWRRTAAYKKYTRKKKKMAKRQRTSTGKRISKFYG